MRGVDGGVHDVVLTTGVATVRLGGPSRALDEHEWRDVETAADASTQIVVDLAGCGRLAGRDIATVAEIARIGARSGVVIELAHVGRSTRRQLVSARLEYLLDQPIRGRADRSSG